MVMLHNDVLSENPSRSTEASSTWADGVDVIKLFVEEHLGTCVGSRVSTRLDIYSVLTFHFILNILYLSASRMNFS